MVFLGTERSIFASLSRARHSLPSCFFFRATMARKRKRSHKQVESSEGPRKRRSLDAGLQSSVVLPKDNAFITHPLLSLYYPRLLTLRHYLQSQLPPSARSRRRRIASAATQHETFDAVGASDYQRNTQRVEDDGALATLLDTTLIGQFQAQRPDRDDSRIRELATLSQKVTSTVGSSVGGGTCSQSEACTILLWSSVEHVCSWHVLWSCFVRMSMYTAHDCVDRIMSAVVLEALANAS